MTACRHLAIALGFLAVGVALQVAFVRWRPTASPRQAEAVGLAEIAQLAEELGLYWRSDRADGTIDQRVVVSTQPVSWLRANDVRLADPEHPCWAETVAVSVPWQDRIDDAERDFSAHWQGVHLYGDPGVIQRLIRGGRQRSK